MFHKWHHLFLQGCDRRSCSFRLASSALSQAHSNASYWAHLGLNVCQLAGLLGWLAEEVGSHLQHGGCLGVHRSSLHFLHPRAHILLDEVLQLQGEQADREYYPGCQIPGFHCGDNHILRGNVPIRSLTAWCRVKAAASESSSSIFSGTVMESWNVVSLGHCDISPPIYPPIHVQAYLRQIPTVNKPLIKLCSVEVPQWDFKKSSNDMHQEAGINMFVCRTSGVVTYTL